MKWALKTACETGCVECRQPTKNRQIHLFKKGENIFTCPCCRVEYTTTANNEVKRVLAKIHVEDKGKYLIQYITKETDTIAFVPLSQILNHKISSKWVTILTIIQCAWEKGDTDIYAMFRLQPDPEFILTGEKIKMPPLHKETGHLREELIIKGQPMIYRMVNVDELNAQLNDI